MLLLRAYADADAVSTLFLTHREDNCDAKWQHGMERGLQAVKRHENFRELRKLFNNRDLRRWHINFSSSACARKGDWHTLCFTPVHEPSITVKPVKK
jgi:hypothetical protein